MAATAKTFHLPKTSADTLAALPSGRVDEMRRDWIRLDFAHASLYHEPFQGRPSAALCLCLCLCLRLCLCLCLGLCLCLCLRRTRTCGGRDCRGISSACRLNQLTLPVHAHRFSYVYTRKAGCPHLLISTHNSGITPQGVTVIAKKKFGEQYLHPDDS